MSGPADLLALARQLAQGKDEAQWRSSASRAYYAAFHALTAWHATLPMPGDPQTARGEHEQLIRRLLNPSKKCTPEQRRTSIWFSGQLSTVRAMRIRADYELDQPVTFEDAMLACGLCGQIFDKL